MPFLSPNQQCQSTEGREYSSVIYVVICECILMWVCVSDSDESADESDNFAIDDADDYLFLDNDDAMNAERWHLS